MEPEWVLATSSTETGIGCWDLHTGTENIRYRSCSSSTHGLVCIGNRLIASSHLREPGSTSSGSVLYCSWNNPQVEVKSFPAEPINPLTSNADGTYIVGGGLSGDIYLWEVVSGRLLKKWHAHYRAVTCLVFSDDQSLLISGAEDGSVRVWSLLLMFDDIMREQARHLFMFSFSEHTLRVTSIALGYEGCNAIIVSASEDRTCKGRMSSMPDRDGKIYIVALNAESDPKSSHGMHIVGLLPDHSKAVTYLALSLNGGLLLSGYEDGVVRVWDTKTRNIARFLRHAKGPVNNILVVRPPVCLNPQILPNSQPAIIRKQGSSLPPPLEKYSNSSDDILEVKVFISAENAEEPLDASYVSVQTMNDQI